MNTARARGAPMQRPPWYRTDPTSQIPNYGNRLTGVAAVDNDPDQFRPYWSTVDGLIPVDADAETTVAGCSVASAEGAALAVERLVADDFHDPRCWQAIDAAGAVPVGLVDGSAEWDEAMAHGDHVLVVQGCAARLAVIAEDTGLESSWLRALVTGRCDLLDRSGWFARRVQAAAEARRRVRELVGQLDAHNVDLTPVLAADQVTWSVADTATIFGRLIAGRASDADMVDVLLDLGQLVGIERSVVVDALLAGTGATS